MEVPAEVKELFAQMPESELVKISIRDEAGIDDVTLLRFLQGNNPSAMEYRSTGDHMLQITCKLRYKK
jgi:hypothetical protein